MAYVDLIESSRVALLVPGSRACVYPALLADGVFPVQLDPALTALETGAGVRL